MHIHVKPRAKFRRMERNNLSSFHWIFMIFIPCDQIVKRKVPSDFQVHLICHYRVMGIKFFWHFENKSGRAYLAALA